MDEQKILYKKKILVVGGFGTGKTTMVTSLSHTRPMVSEEVLTTASIPTDGLAGLPDKVATTVGMDFGKRQIDDIMLYLFGFPGQERFRAFWEELATGALGAIVMTDTRFIQRSWESLAFVEEHDLAHVIVINKFPDSREYPIDFVRHRLDCDTTTPILTCDARQRRAATDIAIALMEHMLQTHQYPHLDPC